MANIVRNRVIVTGPEEDLQALNKALSVGTGADDSLYYASKKVGEQISFGWEAKLDVKEGQSDFFTLFKWGPPLDEIWLISSEFPRLTFDLIYHGQGPVYGRELIRGGDTVMTTRPQKYSEFRELVDLVDYQYSQETLWQFEDRKRIDVTLLMDGAKEYEREMREFERSREVSTATIMGLWFAGIGALGAYSYSKNK
jgi:hypothetical protein